MTSALPARAPGATAHAAFLVRRFGGAPPGQVAALHDHLVTAATEEPDAPRRRAPSISLDGTPVVYSAATGDAPARLRTLADPGGLARDVPAQADFALGILSDLLEMVGWTDIAPELDAVVGAILPPAAAEARELRGGAWIGLVAGPPVELRLYLDLRRGGARARWQRVADALGPFVEDRAAAGMLTALARRVAPHAVPVGLCASVAAGALRGLRLYAGLHAPSPRSMSAIGGVPAEVVAAIGAELGPLAPQEAIAGFDLELDERGALRPRLGRTKLDVACLGRAPAAVGRALPRLAARLRVDDHPLAVLRGDLDACFGGHLVQYVSLSARSGAARMTIYAQPAPP